MYPSSTSSSDSAPKPTKADGLIPVAEHSACTTRERRLGLLVVVAFFTITVGTALVDAVWPVPRIELLGRERAEAARMRSRARIVDGSFARLVEHELNLRSRVRELVNPPYSFYTLTLLGQSKYDVVVGQESRLFLRSRVEPMPDMDEQRVERAAASLAAISRRIAALDRRFLLTLVPRKCRVAEPHLPAWAEPRQELDAVLHDALHERGVECPNLLTAALVNGTDDGWERLGTHWLDASQVRAAEAVIADAGLLVPEEQRTTEIRIVDRRAERHSDLLRMLGLEGTPEVLEYFDSPTWERIDVVRRGTDNHMRRGVVEEGGDVLLYGTSFTARMRFPHYLAHFSQKRVRNEALPGKHSLILMGRSLAETNLDELPEIVMLELPIGLMFGHDDGLGVAATLDALKPSAATRICDIDGIRTTNPMRLDVRSKTLAILPSNFLTRPDDGTVGIRIRRSACDAELMVSAGRHDAHGYNFRWPGEETEIIIPIVGIPEDRPVPISIRTRAPGRSTTVTIESLELVHDLDPDMRPVVVTSDDHPRYPPIDPTKLVVPRHAALVIDRPDAPASALESGHEQGFEIRLHFVDGAAEDPVSATEILSFDAPPARLPAFISLAPYTGRHLECVTVRTSSSAGENEGSDAVWTASIATPRR